jgi:hypothetical protein
MKIDDSKEFAKNCWVKLDRKLWKEITFGNAEGCHFCWLVFFWAAMIALLQTLFRCLISYIKYT